MTARPSSELRRLLCELARLASYPAYGGPPDAEIGVQRQSCREQLERIAAIDPDAIGEEALNLLHEGAHGLLQRSALLTYVAAYGDRAAVDSMLTLARRGDRGFDESRLLPHYFHCALCVIERQKFDPALIERFNGGVAALHQDGEAMRAYHRASRYFAHGFERLRGENLFDRLERGGVQLWDYWMTYGPGTPRDPVGTLS